MVTPITLILGCCLTAIPLLAVQVTDVNICGFRQERTSADCPVRPITILVLSVPFIQDQTKDQIELLKFRIVDVRNDGIYEVIKMGQALFTCIEIVESSDTKPFHQQSMIQCWTGLTSCRI